MIRRIVIIMVPLHLKILGFTLIELLMVVAIIAVLVAILLPALQHARQQAQQIVCIHQQKEVGLGLQLYADDNAGAFLTNEWHHPDYWFERLIKYVQPGHIHTGIMLRCPSGTCIKDYDDKDVGWWDSIDYILREYRGKIDRIDQPSLWGVYCDSCRNPNGTFWWSKWLLNVGENEDARRHNDGINALFLDWHVEYLPDPQWEDINY